MAKGKISETKSDTPLGTVTTVRRVPELFVATKSSPDGQTSVSPPDDSANYAPADATYITKDDESAELANSRRLQGTANQVTLTDDGSDITLSTPQDLHTQTEFQVLKLLWNTVDSLPSPVVLGQVVHLTTDNRLYYGKSPP